MRGSLAARSARTHAMLRDGCAAYFGSRSAEGACAGVGATVLVPVSSPASRSCGSSRETDASEREESRPGAGGSVAVSSAEGIASTAQRFAWTE